MSAGLWTAFEAAAATGGALCARGGDPDRWVAEEWAAHGLSIDTRTLAPGELFVALTDARDGHDFVVNAFERGASAALVARAPSNAPDGAPLLIVPDTLEG
ncbi:MAG TPA: Mur ligase domain-containing protein, partial [Parvularculaceae bacterium]|nr:Mur ligase domain-containing protein [Parvularculaceae bacterium]